MKKNMQIAFFLFITFVSVTQAREWDGSYYRKNSNMQYTVAEQVLSNLKDLPPSPMVLDVGCGDGRVTKELILTHLKAKQVIGIDPSNDMLNKAIQSYGSISNLQFISGSFQKLNEHDAYDIVTTFFSLHWVPRQEQALAVAHMAKALKKGGILITAHIVQPQKMSIRVALHKIIATKKWQSYFPNYIPPIYEADPYELQQLLTENHLRLQRFIVFEYTTTFENDKAFYDWLCGWSPFKNTLGEKHQAFWMEVIKEYRTLTNQNNKQDAIVFKDPVIEIVAQKM